MGYMSSLRRVRSRQSKSLNFVWFFRLLEHSAFLNKLRQLDSLVVQAPPFPDIPRLFLQALAFVLSRSVGKLIVQTPQVHWHACLAPLPACTLIAPHGLHTQEKRVEAVIVPESGWRAGANPLHAFSFIFALPNGLGSLLQGWPSVKRKSDDGMVACSTFPMDSACFDEVFTIN